MLGKLLKHEWRSFWKIPGFVNLFLVIYTLFGVIALHSRLFETDNDILQTLAGLAATFYLISIIVISFALVFYIAIRFFKNMYTDEGYLMHTLPVSQRAMITAKLIVSYIWIFITGTVIIGCILSLLSTLLSIIGADLSLGEIFREFMNLLSTHSDEFKDLFGISYTHAGILLVLILFVSIAYGILMIYVAISLGQLFQKHKVLGSILSYIGIYVVIQVINGILATPMMISELSMTPLLYLALFESIVLCVLFFFLTEWIMRRKLNLD